MNVIFFAMWKKVQRVFVQIPPVPTQSGCHPGNSLDTATCLSWLFLWWWSTSCLVKQWAAKVARLYGYLSSHSCSHGSRSTRLYEAS